MEIELGPLLEGYVSSLETAIEAMEGLLTALRGGDPVSGGPGPTSRGDVGGRAGTRDAAGAADEGPVNVLEAMRRHPAFGSPGR